MKPEMQAVETIAEDPDLQNKKNKLRYVYFGRNLGNNAHSGVTCVGYQVGVDPTTMLVGVAFCSPEDIFSKKKARAIVAGRIAKGLKDIRKENGDLDLGFEVLESVDKPFSDMSYEEIINVIRENINGRVTDLSDIELKKLNPVDMPRFASVCLPFWFEGV